MDDSRFPFDEKKPDAGPGQGASDAGSATGMFAAVPSKAAADDDLLADLLKQKTGAAPANPAPIAAVPMSAETAQKPGDVTRMLEELKALTGAAAPPAQPAPPRPSTPPVAAELKPGEFTQIFRQIPTPKRVVPQVPVPEPPAAQPPAQQSAASAGEFTQFMQKIDGGAQGPAAVQPPAAQAAPPVFAPVSPASPVAASPAAGSGSPGSFTQMFQTLSPGGAPQAAPVVPATPAAPPSGQSSGPGSFTQMFQTLSPNAAPVPEPPRDQPFPSAPSFPSFSEPLKPSPPVPASQPSNLPSNQGGFTQLFNSLSGDGPQQQMPVAPSAAPASIASASSAAHRLQVAMLPS